MVSSISTTFAVMKHLKNVIGAVTFLLCACQPTPPKTTYGEIKANRIDSMIQVAEESIPRLDTLLSQAIEAYNKQDAKVKADKAAMRATKGELDELTNLRARRDSLQVAFDTQCARVRFLHMKQQELQQKQRTGESTGK